MSIKKTATSIESNPLFMLEQGKTPPSNLPSHRKSAKTGNLFFEYVQNVNSLRGVVTSGAQIAEYLESKNLIIWDKAADRYTWINEPMTRSEFLTLLRPALKSVNG